LNENRKIFKKFGKTILRMEHIERLYHRKRQKINMSEEFKKQKETNMIKKWERKYIKDQNVELARFEKERAYIKKAEADYMATMDDRLKGYLKVA